MSTLLSTIIADFTTILASEIAIGGTTATLSSATDDDGVALPSGRYFFTIDGSNSSKEHISCSLSGTALTNIKTVSRQGTETAGVLRKHRIGASISITDFAHILQINNLLNGTTNLNASTPLGYDSAPSITTGNQLATKTYVDGIAIAGSPDATTTTKGISKMSVAPVSATSPIAVGDNDTRVPTQNENDALVGTSGTPSSTNKYITDADATYVNTASKVARRDASGNIEVGTPTDANDATPKTYVDTVTSKFLASGYQTTSVANGTTTVATIAIAGGTLSTNKGIRVRIYGTISYSGVNATGTVNIKYGGTVIGTISALTSGTPTATNTYSADLVLFGSGATNTQRSSMSTVNSGFVSFFLPTASAGSSAIDSTTSQNLVLEIVSDHANVTTSLNQYFVEKII